MLNNFENLDLLKLEKVILRRYKGWDYNDQGHYEHGWTDEKEIDANIQPLNGEEIQQLANYDATRETLKMFTKADIEKDFEIVRNGKEYEINNVEKWYGFNRALIIEKRPENV